MELMKYMSKEDKQDLIDDRYNAKFLSPMDK